MSVSYYSVNRRICWREQANTYVTRRRIYGCDGGGCLGYNGVSVILCGYTLPHLLMASGEYGDSAFENGGICGEEEDVCVLMSSGGGCGM